MMIQKFVRTICVGILLTLGGTVGCQLWAQETVNRSQLRQSPAKSAPFPDEYSEFDDDKAVNRRDNEVINQRLDIARHYHNKGLAAIERGDTTTAAKFFEQAIESLNELASYPGVEQNDEFSDLAEIIIDDYENYVSNIDLLPENSTAFLLKGKLFAEMEKFSKGTAKPGITPIRPSAQSSSGMSMMIIPLPINEAVEKSVAFLTQDRGRKFFKRWLERSGRWFPMMRKIAKEEGVPEEIVYLSMMESGLNPNAVSRAKAVGLWQFMQSTGEEYGLRVTPWIDERRDPEKSTRAAFRYLRDLYNDLGDWHLALASYNCGPGRIKRTIEKSGLPSPSFWDIVDLLPRETKNYVPLYIATTLIVSNAEAYGFDASDLAYEPEYKYDVYEVYESVALEAIAKSMKATVDLVRSLNPELHSSMTPPKTATYKLKIPLGSAQDFAMEYSRLTDEEKRPWVTHVVKKGETLNSIAAQYGVSGQEIAATNDLPGFRSKLKRGASLRIPLTSTRREMVNLAVAERSAGSVPTPPATPVPTNQTEPSRTPNPDSDPDSDQQQTRPAVAGRSATTAVAEARTTEEQTKSTPAANNDVTRSRTTHTVQPGETLYSIAQSNGVRLSDLRSWNGIPESGESIRVGTTLRLNAEAAAVASEPKSAPVPVTLTRLAKPERNAESNEKPSKHIVRRGETLAQIADDYGVDLAELRKLNKVGRRGTIQAGQTVKIPSGGSEMETSTPNRNSSVKLANAMLKTHKVKRGENLSVIAATYSVTENDIRAWNPGLKGERINAGDKIRIFSSENIGKGSAAAAPRSVSRLPKHYVVRRGDTASEIAMKFGLSVSALKARNKALKLEALQVGQRVRLQ